MTDEGFTANDVVDMFLYGLQRLHVDDAGLEPGNDPADLQTVGALSVLVYRIAATAETPYHLALSRVAVLTGALIASPELGGGDSIARKWLIARAELLELRLAANE
jgi:hypothetical protein